jgi:hypothetical protein
MSSRSPIALVWAKEGRLGWEVAMVDRSAGLRANGTAVSADPLPYSLVYELECDADFITRSLIVTSRGAGWERTMTLTRDDDGWNYRAEAHGAVDLPVAEADTSAFRSALDCDLGACQVTNSMPVLRDGLMTGGARDYLMAWVSVPDLRVVPSAQRYEFQRLIDDGAVIRYSSGSFASDVVFDRDGHVVDYPALARRVG